MRKAFYAWTALATAFAVAVILCLRVLWQPQSVAATDGGMTVVLDAGHGGIDGGVTGVTTGEKESDINLAVAYAVKEKLTDMGFSVVMTRKTEGGLYGLPTKGFKRRDMERRKEIIQAADPVFVVSLHQNFYPSKSTRGAQVFYGAQSADGQRLAKCLQTSLNALYAEEGVKGRNAAAADYFMLRCTSAPSVLIECGFLSSAADERLLTSPLFRARLASGIVTGIAAFLEENAA